MEIRADYTVKGADVDALYAEARAIADALAGAQRVAEIVTMHIEVDSRLEPHGTIVAWRSEVQVTIRNRPPDVDEEPF